MMAHDHWIDDISAVQTTPPFEIQLAAHVQDIYEMISDHITLTTLALHVLCPPSVCQLRLTGPPLSSGLCASRHGTI
jgi:hypothetical protein